MTLFENGMFALFVIVMLVIPLSIWYITTTIIEKRSKKDKKE